MTKHENASRARGSARLGVVAAEPALGRRATHATLAADPPQTPKTLSGSDLVTQAAPKAHLGSIGIDAEEIGKVAGRVIVMVHGWGVDRRVLRPLADLLSDDHRVLLLDLRGHGASAAGRDDFSIEAFADDVTAVIAALGLERPIVVGHSMGGLVALELAARGVAHGAVLLECHVAVGADATAPLRPVVERLAGDEAEATVARLLEYLMGPEVDARARSELLAAARRVPRHVLGPALRAALDYDNASAAARVTAPMLYVGTGAPYADLARLRALTRRLSVGQVVASSHFFPMTVPDQVAPMIRAFLRQSLTD